MALQKHKTKTPKEQNRESQTSQGMTKAQSAALQGVAILLMIYHHFFNDLTFFEDQLQFLFPGVVLRFAWFCKICVGIFAFVSGYGMCRVLEKNRSAENESFFKTLGKNYLTCFLKILNLFTRYWMVLLFFIPMLCLLGKETFSASEFLANLFCLEYTYSGAFWYVGQYVKMLLLLPLLDGIFLKCSGDKRNKCFFYGLLLAVCGVLLAAAATIPFVRICLLNFIEWIRIAYILVFFAGYLISKFQIYERITRWLSGQAKILHIGLGAFLLLAAAGLRILLADSAAYARLDFLIVPVFVPGFLLLTEHTSRLRHLLEKIGTISAYIWMTHIFVYGMTASWLFSLTHSHLLFYLVETLLCTLVGGACLWAEKRIRKLFHKIR